MKLVQVCTILFTLSIANIAFAQSDLPAGVSKGWFDEQATAINNMQYTFSATADHNKFIVNNPANHLGFDIHPTGYRVYNLPQSQNDKHWEASFTIDDLRHNSEIQMITRNGIAGRCGAVTYNAGDLAVEYTNSAKGLRQDFIVAKRKAGATSLSIRIQINSRLRPLVVNGKQLLLSEAGNDKDIKLLYDQLTVWDANKNILPARMYISEQTGLLNIAVDDCNAVYPVTIDPLNRTPEWTNSADGILPGLLTSLQLQVQTTYGYTVTGLGVINGDGFDDVAVSAPTMADVITGTGSLTGVGAVFIYLGSPSGLPSTPSKILQPTTGVQGALFGYSVSAGDVTGDGKNDIVIGAPMDS